MYWADRLDRNMGIGQTEQTKKVYRPDLTEQNMIFVRPNRPKYGKWSDKTDLNMGIGQTEQNKKVYRPDQSDQNIVICQTKQTKI